MPVRRNIMTISCWALMLATLGLTAGASAEGLSPSEKQVAAAAAGLKEKAESLLERVVNIPSATQNVEGVRAVGRAFQDAFARLGFKVRWEETPPGMGRAGHLIAEREGDRGPRILLIGHLDTVLEGRAFRREGNKAFGPGTVDMKGGNVVMLTALESLHLAGALDGARVAVVLTGDEEAPGEPLSRSRASMLELAKRSDVALAFEAKIDDTATVARRGVSTWGLRVTGPTGHSAGAGGSRLGSGAVLETARILEGFRTKLSGQDGLTFNPSLIVGGTEVDHEPGAFRGSATGKTNVVGGTVSVEGDLRFISDDQREAAKKAMYEVAAAGLPRTAARLTFIDEYPAMAPTPENHGVLAVLDGASRDLGLGAVRPLDPAERGAGDISFVAPFIKGLDGLGLDGGGSHAPDEWANLDSLVPQAQRAAVLIDRLSRAGPDKAR